MSCRVDTTPLLAGACVVSMYGGHGVRGDNVPSTGTNGPSPVYNDLSLPADAAKEYRWAIVTPPAVGTFTPYEDCSYTYAPPGGTTDLTVTYVYREWEDGVDLGTATETIVIGAGSGTTASVSAAGGIASSEAFGSPTVTAQYPGVGTVVSAGDIASAEAFGAATVTASGVGSISNAGGIASAEAFGTALVAINGAAPTRSFTLTRIGLKRISPPIE